MFIIYEFIFKLIIHVTVCLLFAVCPLFCDRCVFPVHFVFSDALIELQRSRESKAIQFISAVVSRCYSLLFGLTKGYYIKEIVCSLYWLHLWIFCICVCRISHAEKYLGGIISPWFSQPTAGSREQNSKSSHYTIREVLIWLLLSVLADFKSVWPWLADPGLL